MKRFVVEIDEKVFDEMRKDDIYQKADDSELLRTLIVDAAFMDCRLEDFELKVRDDYIRKLKIALLLGLSGAAALSVFGRLVFSIKGMQNAAEDTSKELGDLLGIGHLERDEVIEVLRMLKLESFIVE